MPFNLGILSSCFILFVFKSPFPKSYRTVDKVIVRQTEDPNSQMLNFLPKDTEVTVEEIQGQRARISFPLGGWVSIKSNTCSHTQLNFMS